MEEEQMKYSQEEKEMWVEDWKGSGESLGVYAKANGLNAATLKSWAYGKETVQGFVEIKPARAEPRSYMPEILIEKGDIKIHIPLAVNRNELRAVIESIGWRA
jgi:transposase-like protein